MRKLLLIGIMLILSVSLHAKSLNGVVYFNQSDNVKEPAPFATVYWLETQNIIETDVNGNFTFSFASVKEATLVATYVGYTRDTIRVTPDMSDLEFNLYPENELGSIVVTGKQDGNYLSKVTPVRTEVISAAGLCKMACCNLAESFENSASVSVGYSDAVTGARQIRLLGLSGVYTAMLDENRPVMRGLASPFGLSYIPGQWLESIQIAKGPSSVVNGLEAITGQINMEHRKPTAEQPLFINLFLSNMLRTEANVASSLQLDDNWSTVILGHFSTDPAKHDSNKDGFRDEPNTMQFNFSNRWLYFVQDGIQVRFGVRALSENRTGGQMDYEKGSERNYYKEGDSWPSAESGTSEIWGSEIKNRGINAYVKVGIPFTADQKKNMAFVADYSYHNVNSFYGMKDYNGDQHSGFFNVMYNNEINDSHKFILGLSAKYDRLDETLNDFWLEKVSQDNSMVHRNLIYPGREEVTAGVYGEYTYHYGEKLTAIGGLRLDYSNLYGYLFAPRMNLKYSFTDNLVFRATGGRGFRTPNIVADNLGMLSTGRRILVDKDLDVEDAWTYGANLTSYFKLGYGEDAYVSFDYFRTDFMKQVIVDQELQNDAVRIYNLNGGKSYTNSYQVDFSMEPVERFTVMATFRYTDAKVELQGQGLVDSPLMSKYKGVLNLQYATRMNIWTFDFTAQLNGPARLPYFVENRNDAYSPVYPMFYAQVTRKFKNVDVYVGGENLLNYKQPDPIINAENPYATDFNSTAIWGPLMGIKVYAGLRFTLWKN